jgi:hypothetical protein
VGVAIASIPLASPAPVAAANASNTTYFVTVFANEPYGLSPTFQTRTSPALPAGASLAGLVTCDQVYVNGATGPTESVHGNNPNSTRGLDAGSYFFVTDSCNPLWLTGAPGTVVTLGGVYNISTDPTSLIGVGVETTGAGSPVVVLRAALINHELDDSFVPGQTIMFGYQRSDGIWIFDCPAVTISDGNGRAPATCTFPPAEAQSFVAGTGNWQANYDGHVPGCSVSGPCGNLGGSSYVGHLPGQTSTTQAAANMQIALAGHGIQIVQTTLPPDCHPAAQQTAVSVIGVSLGQLNCSELQILTIVTGVALGFAFGGGEAGVLVIAEVAETVAINAAIDGVNALRLVVVNTVKIIASTAVDSI